MVGTLPYMSPERLAGPGAGGPESDVYALAAVAYELLSGQPPSEADLDGRARPPGRRPTSRRDWPEAPRPRPSPCSSAGLDAEPGQAPAVGGTAGRRARVGAVERGATAARRCRPGRRRRGAPARAPTAARPRSRPTGADGGALGRGAGGRAARARPAGASAAIALSRRRRGRSGARAAPASQSAEAQSKDSSRGAGARSGRSLVADPAPAVGA